MYSLAILVNTVLMSIICINQIQNIVLEPYGLFSSHFGTIRAEGGDSVEGGGRGRDH
jgi:hypothetical protein